jgi:hypothetical protein
MGGHGAWTVAGLSLGSFFFSLILLVAAIVAFPPDYFARSAPPPSRHPVLHALAVVGRNLLGLLFVCVGLVLSVPGVPGQGFLTIALGVLMLDLPKKRAIERRLLRGQRLATFVNGIRRRFGRPPLRIDPELS